MLNSTPAKPALHQLVIGLLTTLVAMLALLLVFRDAWITQEARYYFSGENQVHFSLLKFFIVPDGTNARLTSMLFSSVFTNHFGANVTLINASHIVFLSLGLFLFYWHALQVSQSTIAAMMAFVLTLLSSPLLNMVLWHATQHDQIMLIFSAAALIVHCRFVRNAASRHTASVVGYTVLLLVLVALANNAKETALFIVPCLLIQPLLFAPSSEPFNWKQFAPAAIVTAYDLIFFAIYRLHLHAGWSEHISGGNPVDTGVSLAGFLVHSGDFMSLSEFSMASATHLVWVPRLLWTGLAIVVVGLTASRREIFSGRLPSIWRPVLYFAVMGSAVVCLTLGTKHPSAYYMWVPQWAVAMIAGLLLAQAIQTRSIVSIAGWLAGLTLIVAQAANFGAYFQDGGAARRLLDGSHHMSDMAAIMRADYAEHQTATYVIDNPESLDGSWYLLGGMGQLPIDPYLGPYIFRLSLAQSPKILTQSQAHDIPDAVHIRFTESNQPVISR